MSRRLAPGKVPWDLVAGHVRGKLPPEVVLGPAAGEDAALVTIGGETWAVASDPVSFTAENAGRLAVLVNANDVAVRGARPSLFLAVVLVAPHEADEARVAALLEQISATCAEIGATLVGGHTEVTPGLTHSIVVGTMLGRVAGRAITTGGLREGDLVGMTRSAGLEGSSILLDEFGDRLAARLDGAARRELERALVGDALSVVAPALAAAADPAVTALHDVTEGGVGEALHELALASGLAIETSCASIPVLAGTRQLADALGIDPLGLIGSGALLVGAAPEGAARVASAIEATGVPFAWIGHAVRALPAGVLAVPRFPRDEITRALALRGVRGVVFDLDGTLVDSRYDWTAIRATLGVTGPSIIDDLNGRPEPERTALWERLFAIERDASRAASAMPGAERLLALIRRHGLGMALVTNNTDENTLAMLERFGLALDHVLTRDSGLWKPSGAPIREAMRRLALPPERCAVVGDSLYDLHAGREAGAAAVVIVGDTSREVAREADLAFPDLESLIEHLDILLESR